MEWGQRNLLVIGRESESLARLNSGLAESGFDCSVSPYKEEVIEQISEKKPDAVIIEINGYVRVSEMRRFINRIKHIKGIPVLALASAGIFKEIGDSGDIDDFLMSPYNTEELVLRLRRLLNRDEIAKTGEIIVIDGLKIDLARCEVTVSGKKVELTFKEYELLRFLAANPGRVHTRESLLDKVWGLDYFGGDRTVDVHIRRLRSKIDTPDNEFIETVRNIGYRFKRKK
jgi:DNA-binding response OmpR family regulator